MSSVETYVGAIDRILRLEMDLVKAVEETISRSKFEGLGGSEFQKGKELMTLLKSRLSKGDAETLVNASPEENGWEAWRRLNAFYDPTLAVKESEVTADFSLMPQASE